MSPAHDVLPIVWTDYTYDSEHSITEGVPLAFSDTTRVPGEEPPLFQHWSVLSTFFKNSKNWAWGAVSGRGRGETENTQLRVHTVSFRFHQFKNTNKCTAICTLYQKHIYECVVATLRTFKAFCGIYINLVMGCISQSCKNSYYVNESHLCRTLITKQKQTLPFDPWMFLSVNVRDVISQSEQSSESEESVIANQHLLFWIIKQSIFS